MTQRMTTGIEWLDSHLGGGVISGTMTLILGATGIGKSHLGISFAHQGKKEDGTPGIIFDMLSRGDSQNHQNYAKSLFDWPLESYQPIDLKELWDKSNLGHYFQVFEEQGKKVHRSQLTDEDWHRWQVKIQSQVQKIAQFFYAHFIRGVKRVVVDGVEPVTDTSESAQHELFEYLYHKVIQSEDEWLAREVLRQDYRSHSPLVHDHPYDSKEITTVFLQTTEETMIHDLIARKAYMGGLEANANTIILMGRVIEGDQIGRRLYIAKHRGSYASDQLIPFEITGSGLVEML